MPGRGVIALMYHGVGAAADPAEGERYTVTAEAFDAQLALLERHHALRSVRDGAGGGGVVLTFDDGERSVVTEALPRLARRGATAAAFIVTGWIGRRGYVDAADVRALHGAGWLVGGHGHSHRFLTTLSARDLDAELRRCRDALAEVTGERPTHLAFPGGRTSPLVEAAARAAGFTTLWSSVPGVNRALGGDRPVRRIAVRRGDGLGRFGRLARRDALALAAERASVAMRDVARQALGDERYHTFTARLLAAMGRR